MVYRRGYLKTRWVFFQRAKKYGGGYWLGRTYKGAFIIEYDKPVLLYDGIGFLMMLTEMEKRNGFEVAIRDALDEQLTLF